MKECITLVLDIEEFKNEIERETGVKIHDIYLDNNNTRISFDTDSVIKLFKEDGEYDPQKPDSLYDDIYTINFDLLDTIGNRYGAQITHLITNCVANKIFIILEE